MGSSSTSARRLTVLLAVVAITVLGLPALVATADHAGGGGHATADLITDPDTPSISVGTVHFLDANDESTSAQEQGVVVIVDIDAESGLAPGFHGFHIHANDQGAIDGCRPDADLDSGPFDATDGHYGPGGENHGDHAGDMPVIQVEEDGSALAAFLTDRFTIQELVSPQRAVIIHGGPDNYANIPDRYRTDEGTGPDSTTLATGDAGSRVACGEIEAREADPPQAQTGADALAALLTSTDGSAVGFSVFGALDDGSGFLAGTVTFASDPALTAVSSGFHGQHVHGGNRCQFAAGAYDLTYAQGHLAPDGDDHPTHAGDLPVLLRPETATVQANGFGAFGLSTTDRLDRDHVKGRTVIIHGKPDNYANIPGRYEQTDGEGGVPDAITLAGGDSGDRVACGMIEGLVRLAGATRIDTAVEISQDSFLADGSAESVVLARADVFADALAGVPLAEANNAPVLLTWPDELTSEAATELERVLPDGGTVYLLGGEKALNDEVETAVENLGFEPARLEGRTRFNTAVDIADELDATHDTIFVTTGFRWPDAVSAGAAASQEDAVILFSQGDDPDPATDAYLAGHDGEPVFAIGGPAARAYPGATGVFGRDRNSTSVAVAQEFFDGPAYVGLARDGEAGDDLDHRFADALTGGVHVGRLGGPMLLVDEDRMPDSVRQYLEDNAGAIVREYAYGGTAAISEAVASASEDAANETGQLQPLSEEGWATWRRFVR